MAPQETPQLPGAAETAEERSDRLQPAAAVAHRPEWEIRCFSTEPVGELRRRRPRRAGHQRVGVRGDDRCLRGLGTAEVAMLDQVEDVTDARIVPPCQGYASYEGSGDGRAWLRRLVAGEGAARIRPSGHVARPRERLADRPGAPGGRRGGKRRRR